MSDEDYFRRVYGTAYRRGFIMGILSCILAAILTYATHEIYLVPIAEQAADQQGD